MRLIDADALKKEILPLLSLEERIIIENKIDNALEYEQEVYLDETAFRQFMEGYKEARRVFKRPQGEWINHRNDYGHNIADCSLCGKTMQWHDEDGDGVPRYCWYCGAPMKGVAE